MVEIEEKIDIVSDQSSFSAQQSVLQAPPPDPNAKPPRFNKKMIFLFGMGVFILLVTLIVLSSLDRAVTPPEAVASPSPTPFKNTTQMEQQLKTLQDQINKTNPDDVLVYPPQVDMEIEF